MRSTLAMTLAGFGVVFLSFGSVALVLGLVGLRYGSRTSLGGAGLLALGGIVIGAILFGAGVAVERRNDHGKAASE